MKKVFSILIFVIIISLVIPIHVEASSGKSSNLSWNNIKNVTENFLSNSSSSNIRYDPSKLVSGIAGILTTIGVIIILALLLTTGMKFMTASPEEASKLKQRLVGLVVAGVVILGAYGIWIIVGGILERVTSPITILPVNTATPTTTPTPDSPPMSISTPIVTPLITPTPTAPVDLGETYTSSFVVEEPGAYKGQTIDYWASIPKSSVIGSYEKVPLIIFLHGREEGRSISAVQSVSLPLYMKQNSVTPKAIVVAPRFPNAVKQWSMPPVEVYATVKHIIAEAKSKGITIDESNISVTGFSIGGTGALDAIRSDDYGYIFNKAVLISPQDYPGDLTKVKCETKVYFESSDSKGYSTSWKNVTGNGQWTNIEFNMPSGYSAHSRISEIYKDTDVIDWMIGKNKEASNQTANITLMQTKATVENLGKKYDGSFSLGNYTRSYFAYIPDVNLVGTYENIPLVIFLQGIEEGDRSINDLSILKSSSLPSYINSGTYSPKAVVIAPKFPGSYPSPSEVYATVEHMIAEAKEMGITIDKNNISITGFSMGGAAALKALVNDTEDRFSSAVLVSPATVPGNVEDLKCPIKVIYECGANENRNTWCSILGINQRTTLKAENLGKNKNIQFEISQKIASHMKISQTYYDEDLVQWMIDSSQQNT